ncbi:AAA family ATPase [Bernardetia sp. Wsw4-3y2]|uniref:AAA family ATPase n=1 Tax=Bernardetia sp. Wsw4-3y2 TaxID=3127471 RepID=UPI0030D511B6
MILTIKNLGALKEAEIDLNKDLILLCGHNNTGKTYVAYLIYDILHLSLGLKLSMSIQNLLGTSHERNNISLPLVKSAEGKEIIFFAKQLIENKKIEIDISKFTKKLVFNLKNEIAKNIMKEISSENSLNIFFSKEILEKLSFELNYTEEFIKNNLRSSPVDEMIYWDGETRRIKAKKEKNSCKVIFELLEDLSLDEDLSLEFVTMQIYFSILRTCLNFSFRSFIFTSEREAIDIFSEELALNNNNFFYKILKTNGETKTKLLEFIDSTIINRYPKPIVDGLFTAQDLINLQKEKSEFEFLAIELEKTILEGKISVGQNETLQYQPNFYTENGENVVLEIYQTSSLVKSLASLVFYLRHSAKKNDCIIIEEPELNLYPDNQILVARFLARLVNEGFKVVATTHSDYIIKELSTLLLLSDSFKDKDRIMEKYGYTQNQILNKENIGVYYFEKGKETAVNVPITERGIEIESIDQTISDLNERFNTIYYTFLESDEKKEEKRTEKNLKSN